MGDLNVWEYKRMGTPEHILLKSGVVAIDSSGDESKVIAGPKFAGLFKDNAVPAIEDVATPMVDLVFANLFDRSGYLDGSSVRVQASATLREAGISEAGLASLNKTIDQTATEITSEMSKAAKLRR
jgi:hypothetical protein